ncbi:MAG: hypothetical protein QM628_14275 [Propionicimonas sp.]
MRRVLRSLVAAILGVALLWAGPTSVADAKNPKPPKELTTSRVALDAHLGYQPQTTCSPKAKPGTTALLKLLISTWGGSSSGISRSCAVIGRSEHKEGRALDWHMSVKSKSQRKRVDQALTWMTANNGEVAYRLGIMYIIWNQKIWSTYYPELGWRKMENRGSSTANHKDHVHISLSWDGAMKRTSWWTGVPVTVPLNSKCSGSGPTACLPTAPRASGRSWKRVKAPATFLPTPWKTPNLGGSPRVGLTLTAVPGTWVPAGAEVRYRWLVGKKPIAGATGETFVPTPAQVGKVITLEVSVNGQAKKNAELAAVYSGVFTRVPKPRLIAPVAVGEPVAVKVGDWAVPPASFSYQWKRNGKKIKKATKAVYRPTKADRGKKLTVTVTARAPGYVTKSVTSAAVKVASPLLPITVLPLISGNPVVGGKLTATPGTWKPAPTSLSYQWYADNVAIPGATTASLELTSNEIGKQVKVRVRANRSGYSARYAWSEPVAIQEPAPEPTPTATPTPAPTAEPQPTNTADPTPTPSTTPTQTQTP